jgi:hypothetical protein
MRPGRRRKETLGGGKQNKGKRRRRRREDGVDGGKCIKSNGPPKQRVYRRTGRKKKRV